MKVIRGDELQFIPAGHENPERPAVCKRVLAHREELFPGRVQMVNWAKLKAGSEFARHYHEDMEEIFVIIEGAATATVNGARVTLTKGDAIVISPGEVHQMAAGEGSDVEYIVIGIAGEKNGKTVVVP